MEKFRPLQEPIRLQDLLNSARSRTEKKNNAKYDTTSLLELLGFTCDTRFYTEPPEEGDTCSALATSGEVRVGKLTEMKENIFLYSARNVLFMTP